MELRFEIAVAEEFSDLQKEKKTAPYNSRLRELRIDYLIEDG